MTGEGAQALALLLAVTALPVAVGAAALGGVAWWSGRGRNAHLVLDRAADLERSVTSAVASLLSRIESAEATIRSLATEAGESFERADRARKRADRDLARAAATLETDGQVAEQATPLDRAGQLRLVTQRLHEQGL